MRRAALVLVCLATPAALVAVTVPNLFSNGAVADATQMNTVVGPARLSKATIEAFWSPARELLMVSEHGGTGTTRAAWSEACVLDLGDNIPFPSSVGAVVNPALGSTTARCGLPSSPTNLTIEPYTESVSCGFSFRNTAQTRYFLLSAVTTYTSAICSGIAATAGRSWGGSAGNGGCNVTRWFVR